jgi:hypothetical protein
MQVAVCSLHEPAHFCGEECEHCDLKDTGSHCQNLTLPRNFRLQLVGLRLVDWMVDMPWRRSDRLWPTAGTTWWRKDGIEMIAVSFCIFKTSQKATTKESDGILRALVVV